MWAEPTKIGLRAAESLASPAGELLVAAHRVLELGAVRLDRIAGAGRGPDRSAQEDVVAEDEVGRQLLAHRRCVALHPLVELVAGAVLHQLDLIALVAVEHEDRQQAAHVRPDDRGAAEVVALGVRFLLKHGDVVARPASTRARALACRRSSRCHRAGSRAREEPSSRDGTSHHRADSRICMRLFVLLVNLLVALTLAFAAGSAVAQPEAVAAISECTEDDLDCDDEFLDEEYDDGEVFEPEDESFDEGDENFSEFDEDGDGEQDFEDFDDDGDEIGDADDFDDDNDDIEDTDDFDDDNDGIDDADDRDSDDDGEIDTKDADDDEDGVGDAKDCDRDNDGAPDSKDGDDDGDGIADAKDFDDDNDGIADRKDFDDDNDGAGDRSDPDNENDGLADLRDGDDDNDSVADVKDADFDNDGARDSRDKDDDGDGVADAKDSDDDNDGLTDAKDADDDNNGVPDKRASKAKSRR